MKNKYVIQHFLTSRLSGKKKALAYLSCFVKVVNCRARSAKINLWNKNKKRVMMAIYQPRRKCERAGGGGGGCWEIAKRGGKEETGNWLLQPVLLSSVVPFTTFPSHFSFTFSSKISLFCSRLYLFISQSSEEFWMTTQKRLRQRENIKIITKKRLNYFSTSFSNLKHEFLVDLQREVDSTLFLPEKSAGSYPEQRLLNEPNFRGIRRSWY